MIFSVGRSMRKSNGDILTIRSIDRRAGFMILDNQFGVSFAVGIQNVNRNDLQNMPIPLMWDDPVIDVPDS